MKKYLIALFCLVCSVSGCQFKDVFYVTNANDLVTVTEGTLVNDLGYVYTIQTDATDKGWNQEGSRLYIVFDIVDRQWDITLHEYTKVTIAPVSVGIPVDEEGKPVIGDPVEVTNNGIGGGYLNMVLKYYRKPGSDASHAMSLYYNDKAADSTLELRLIHDGNGENPVQMSSSDLVQDTAVYSFPLEGMVPKGSYRSVTITIDYLNTKEDVQQEILQGTYALYTYPIYF